MYCSATSRAVSNVAQKYGGDSIHPICNDFGFTSFVLWHPTSGKTYAKFHSSCTVQSMHQNPSLMSHFAIKTFASSSAEAMA
jgi:hypothetical protein